MDLRSPMHKVVEGYGWCSRKIYEDDLAVIFEMNILDLQISSYEFNGV